MPDTPDLLLALLRHGVTTAPPAAAAETTWAALLEAAPSNLHPYLARRLTDLGLMARVPAVVRGRLEGARRGAAVGFLQRQAWLRGAARALDAAGIPFVVLKGAALAHLAYPEPSLRPMSDLDLWTLPRHLDDATQVLLGTGLRYSERRAARTAAALRAEAASTRVLEAPGTPVVVELHGRLKSMAGLPPAWAEEAWARAAPCDLGGVAARVLHPEDMLTHLLVHSSVHHQFEFGLPPLVDVSLWLARMGPGADWPGMVARWRRHGCSTWVYLTLSLAHELLDAPVPEEFFRLSARPPHFDELHALARAQVLEATLTLPPALARLSATPTAGGRAGWLLRRLTSWYWAGPEGGSRTPLQAMRDAGRRMAHDLAFKLPPYLRGLADGSLRGTAFRRRRELAIGRQRLLELVAAERPPDAADRSDA